MARGGPDYGSYGGKALTYPIIDVGELAARLGSPVSYDRRGEVILMEDFNNALSTWYVQTGHASDYVAPDREFVLCGDYSVHLHSAANIAGAPAIFRAIALPYESLYGLEYWTFISSSWGNLLTALWFLVDGEQFTAALLYDVNGDELYYYNSGAGWTSIYSGAGAFVLAPSWHPFKMVVDYTTGEYVRVIAFGQEFDLSGVDMASGAIPGENHMLTYIEMQGEAGGVGDAYLDRVIWTSGEPDY